LPNSPFLNLVEIVMHMYRIGTEDLKDGCEQSRAERKHQAPRYTENETQTSRYTESESTYCKPLHIEGINRPQDIQRRKQQTIKYE
jgi:hypothetical protein